MSRARPLRYRGSAAGGRGLAIAWLLVLAALLVQSVIVRTHLHALGPAAVHERPGAALSTAPARAADDGDCPFCEEASSAGDYLDDAAPPLLAAPAAIGALPPAVPAPRRQLGPRHRGWRNRGPPPTSDDVQR